MRLLMMHPSVFLKNIGGELKHFDFFHECLIQGASNLTLLSLLTMLVSVRSIPHWPMPAVRDLTRDGKMEYLLYSCTQAVQWLGKSARMGHPLKLLLRLFIRAKERSYMIL